MENGSSYLSPFFVTLTARAKAKGFSGWRGSDLQDLLFYLL
jgi:hypothetical protein